MTDCDCIGSVFFFSPGSENVQMCSNGEDMQIFILDPGLGCFFFLPGKICFFFFFEIKYFPAIFSFPHFLSCHESSVVLFLTVLLFTPSFAFSLYCTLVLLYRPTVLYVLSRVMLA